MAIPIAKDIEIPLLHLIYRINKEVNISKTYKPLADYFNLSEKDRNEFLKSGISKRWNNRVQRSCLCLVSKGFLDSSTSGILKITSAGKKELFRLKLKDKPFPLKFRISNKKRSYRKKRKYVLLSQEEQELIQMVIDDILPEGPKDFPTDFLSDNIELYEIEVPGIKLCIDPFSKTLVTSLRGYFNYQAKNPAEAKYILYANKVGQRRIQIPKNNFTIFEIVTSYEKYLTNTIKRCFKLFLYFTCDEYRAEKLIKIVRKELDLRERI